MVVWEPILVTDWKSPSGVALARIPDERARQFWDPKHLVANELARVARQKPGQPEPDCCVSNGFHWDEALLYATHSRWKDESPSVFWNGPVAKISPALERVITEQP